MKNFIRKLVNVNGDVKHWRVQMIIKSRYTRLTLVWVCASVEDMVQANFEFSTRSNSRSSRENDGVRCHSDDYFLFSFLSKTEKKINNASKRDSARCSDLYIQNTQIKSEMTKQCGCFYIDKKTENELEKSTVAPTCSISWLVEIHGVVAVRVLSTSTLSPN